jgi:hypothetical protein
MKIKTTRTGPTLAQTAPKMKMTTDIPPDITTPGTVETRLGTLKFFDGLPDKETTQKVYDNLDFQRGVAVVLNTMPAAGLYATREGFATMGPANQTVCFVESLLDSKSLVLTATLRRYSYFILFGTNRYIRYNWG